jgi:hypothetical protein
MHKKQTLKTWLKSWQPFLPEKAILMARVSSPSYDPSSLYAKQIKMVLAETPFQDKVLFIEEAVSDALQEAQVLFDRMLAAIHLRTIHAISEIPNRTLLVEQVRCIAPKLLVTLGPAAAHILLMEQESFSNFHFSDFQGKWHTTSDLPGLKILATFHPTGLLENPSFKRQAWLDLKLAAKELGIPL